MSRAVSRRNALPGDYPAAIIEGIESSAEANGSRFVGSEVERAVSKVCVLCRSLTRRSLIIRVEHPSTVTIGHVAPHIVAP